MLWWLSPGEGWYAVTLSGWDKLHNVTAYHPSPGDNATTENQGVDVKYMQG